MLQLLSTYRKHFKNFRSYHLDRPSMSDAQVHLASEPRFVHKDTEGTVSCEHGCE